MADIKTKLFTLAGAVTVFAGMAFGQTPTVTCSSTSQNAVFLRAESATELTAEVTLNCSNTGGAATMNLTVYMSPSVNVTSATIGSGGSAKNEAMAGLTGNFPNVALGTGTQPTNGSNISGNTIQFNGIAAPAAAGAFTVTITNIRVNASAIATSSGVPTAVTETIFLSGTGVTPNVLSTGAVGYVTNGLTSVKSAGIGSNSSITSVQICTGTTTATEAFDVQFKEAFATAFKTQGTVAGNSTLNSEFVNNTETGFGFPNGSNSNLATSGTRVMIVFNNVPANVVVYVPQVITDTVNSTGKMTLTQSATGAFSGTTLASTSGSNPPPSGVVSIPMSNGSGTAVYEYTTPDNSTVESYKAVVYLGVGGSTVPAPASAITATVSFGPIGSSSSVPNFVSGSSTTTVSGSPFVACNTTLLFPFVTNQLGFDTGLAISNTSTDTLASGGKNSVTAQSGTCALTFFGANAPTAAVTTANVATATTYTAAASTLAPNFQGYMIASCNFQYAHGFAYVVYNLTQNNGAAMGYLGLVLPAGRASVESLNN